MPLLSPENLSDPSSSDEILDVFLGFLETTGTTPYDHQEEAILELFAGNNVILNTPTGSGKSLVALALQFRAICMKRRSYYTVPIKALANEKFLSLCNTFGPENVGMITGDATVNATAPVICCTAEILANLALREGSAAPADDIIMDEFHYYSDHERGISWQIPLLTLPNARFLLMSATIGDTEFFQKCITDLTQAPTVLVKSENRPVPLEFDFSTIALEEKIEELVTANRAPIYLVHFSQLAAAKTAQDLMSRNFCTKEEKEKINELLLDADFRSPYGKEIKKLLRHGLGLHHAGLLPKYRTLVEKLAQKGLLKVICGTDTLGVGVNVPIRTVVFTQLFKYGGQSTKTLAVRDFKQIAGRAGRRGFDDVGYVVAQAPEHVIANIKAEAKAAAKGGKSKAQKKKPPEKGFVNWDENTFRKLIDSPSEKLSSSFVMRHGMLLNVLSRSTEDGCEALRKIIRDSHETSSKKAALRKRAFELFRGLVEGNILKIIPKAERSGPVKIALNIELQDDFSLNQALGLYLVETVPRLDIEDPAYPLNVISLAEAIVEDPAQVLRKQVDKAKDKLVSEMKADGIEYDARMDALDQVEHPKPGKDFIYDTYNEFVLSHPWAKEASVRPKSIAREMFEDYSSFEDYIKTYGLERSEAVLLRHLSEVYKILAQTVPPSLKTEELLEAESYFEEMLRATDSSLLDEWEKMRNPESIPEQKQDRHEQRAVPYTRRKQAFIKDTRAAVLSFVKSLSQYNYEAALAAVASDLTIPQLAGIMDEYHQTHGFIRLDPEARNMKHTKIEEIPGKKLWRIEQTLIDEEGLNDFLVILELDLEKSDETSAPVLRLQGFEAI
ncbi:DEAD/DEAH box helicase [Luteolibacter algae]|uniref:DEAD/DEAH box helicase n=1 Tax=Luteolibacter algae TaxID=454151 RepID=A0ABW5D8F0_9BACT